MNKKLMLLTLSLMMTALIPNAYSVEPWFVPDRYMQTADGVVVATNEESGETVRVKINNPSAPLEDQTMTIKLCLANDKCKFLVNSSYKVEYLDEQKFDEYAKTAAAGTGLVVAGVAAARVTLGRLFVALFSDSSKNAFLVYILEMNVPALVAFYYGSGALAGVSTAVLPGMMFDAANPLHHYDVADALDSVLESGNAKSVSAEPLSDEDFKEFVEVLEEGLRSAFENTEEQLMSASPEELADASQKPKQLVRPKFPAPAKPPFPDFVVPGPKYE